MQIYPRETDREAVTDRVVMATIQPAQRRPRHKLPARSRTLSPKGRAARFVCPPDLPPRLVRDLVVLPLAADVGRDIDQALRLARSQPYGPLAAAVRTRLASHIAALAGPARVFAERLPEGERVRDVALGTVRHARALAERPGAGDPAAVLRLLANSTERLWTYATGEAHEPAAEPAPRPSTGNR